MWSTQCGPRSGTSAPESILIGSSQRHWPRAALSVAPVKAPVIITSIAAAIITVSAPSPVGVAARPPAVTTIGIKWIKTPKAKGRVCRIDANRRWRGINRLDIVCSSHYTVFPNNGTVDGSYPHCFLNHSFLVVAERRINTSSPGPCFLHQTHSSGRKRHITGPCRSFDPDFVF